MTLTESPLIEEPAEPQGPGEVPSEVPLQIAATDQTEGGAGFVSEGKKPREQIIWNGPKVKRSISNASLLNVN